MKIRGRSRSYHQANISTVIKMCHLPSCYERCSRSPLGYLAAADAARERRSAVKRRILAVIAAAVLSLGVAAPMAYADPDFGPGNSSKGPNDGGAKCHPPGQTTTEPGCK